MTTHVLPSCFARQGAAAEDALDALLRQEDPQLLKRALEVLQDIATEKSLPGLREVVATDNQDVGVSTLARAIYKKLEPTGLLKPVDSQPSAKPVNFVLLLSDLDGENLARRREAVAKLPFIAPNDQRAAVMSRLTDMLKRRDPAVHIEDIVQAMIPWANADSVKDLEPMLDKDGDPILRHASMKVLAEIKDARGAIAVVRWLQLDAQPTVETLTAMGPVAEDVLLQPLRHPNGVVRTNAARILERIGTRKCLVELTRAAGDRRDPIARQAAQFALEAVKTRHPAPQPKSDSTTAPTQIH